MAKRLPLYLNAKDCALEWIEESAKKAQSTGKSALFFMLHASFYGANGRRPIGNSGIGEYYKDRLWNFTKRHTPKSPVRKPYVPLFRKLTEVALTYPELSFHVVHSDAHEFRTVRMNPHLHNSPRTIHSNHNLMIHMVEGNSRALTMYSRFTVDPTKFQPINLHLSLIHI